MRNEGLRKTQRERQTNAPRPLPGERWRALTLPLLAQPKNSILDWMRFRTSIKQQTYDQPQSTLITGLPAEVRQIIWVKVLGERLLHIVRAPKRLLAIECVEDSVPNLETLYHGCWGSTTHDWINVKGPGFYTNPHREGWGTPANLLPLLRTCRVTYSESISLLYERNIFDINHFDTFTYLKRSILPHRLNQIRTLNISWEFVNDYSYDSPAPYDLRTWSEACDVLASFKGLQELTVHLLGKNGLSLDGRWKTVKRYWKNEKSRWGPVLEPLARSTAQKKFIIFLPWLVDECTEANKTCGYPFQLSTIVNPPPSSVWDRGAICSKVVAN